MKLLLIVFTCLFVLNGYAQGNRVFSGGEMVNHSIVDISPVGGISWSTERASLPGYFSAINLATYTGCTDLENIDGYVKKYGNKAFIFPVGSGNDIRTLEISAPSVFTDAYATAWILGNPSLNLDPTSPNAGPHSVFEVIPPIVEVSTVGQWDWQIGNAGNLGSGTTGTGVGLNITVSIPDMTLFAQKPYLRLVGWNGTSWIDLSGSSTANGNIENSMLSGSMIEGITAIGIGKIESPFVIILENFKATQSNCNTILSWKTIEEMNSDLFIVEQSLDMVNFKPITSVKAKGSSFGGMYSVVVTQPPGDAYYRLKMNFNDSTFKYSSMITNHNDCTNSDYMIAYPNPVSDNDNINLSITTNYRGRADFLLFDGIGKRIKTKPIELTEGQNVVSTSMKGLSSGTYFIVVLNKDGKQIGDRLKFLIQ